MNKIGLIIIPIFLVLTVVSISGYASEDVDEGEDTSSEGEKTYCDVPNPSDPCHDRKDYSETTGLYTCIDGSHEEDWKDCDGGGTDENADASLCQEEDDYCSTVEGCHETYIDCIDDTKFDEDDYDG